MDSVPGLPLEPSFDKNTVLERKMAPSAPKKERQGVTPDSKMTKERAMQLKGALINYAKKSNDAIKGMMNFQQNFYIFVQKWHFFTQNFRWKSS